MVLGVSDCKLGEVVLGKMFLFCDVKFWDVFVYKFIFNYLILIYYIYWL